MSQANQLPRSTRQSDYDALPGKFVYGPTDWLAFDAVDIVVLHRPAGETKWLAPTVPFTVTLAGSPAGFPIATFTAELPSGAVRLVGRRVHPRITDVTRGGAIMTPLLERELDTQASVLQELRRDVDGNAGMLGGLETVMADAVEDTAASAALAAEWAQKPVDQPISTTPTGRSALHYAAAAQQSATDAATYAGMVGGIIFDFGLLSDAVAGVEDWGTL